MPETFMASHVSLIFLGFQHPAKLHPGYTVYCPQCRIEFAEGFTECYDCLALLLPGTLPLSATKGWDHSQDLVVVFETNDRERLGMATELLERAGIPFSVLGQLAVRPKNVNPFLDAPYFRSKWYNMAMTFTPSSPYSPSPWVQVKSYAIKRP
jgi:hypothetical protein